MQEYLNKYPESIIVGENRKPVQFLACGKVRRYDSHDPRLAIEVATGVVVFDNYNPFESHTIVDLDKVEFLRAGEGKQVILFTLGNSKVLDGEKIHEVHSPDALVGYAYGDHLEYHFAQQIYPTSTIRRRALSGSPRFDAAVSKYLRDQLDIPGLLK